MNMSRIDTPFPLYWGGASLRSIAVAALWVLLAFSWPSAHAQVEGLRGTLIVLNKGEATVSLFDLGSLKEAARVPVGAGPHEVAVSPDGALAVVANYGQREPGDTLSVIDVAAARVLRTIALRDGGSRPLQRPHGLRYLDARRVVVTAEAQRAIAIVDVPAGRVTRTLPTEQSVSHMVATGADGRWAYVANIGAGTVTRVDLLGELPLLHVPTGKGAEGVALAPDSRTLWVSNREADTVTVLSAPDLSRQGEISAPGFPIRVAFTPDGKRALVTAPRADALHVYSVATRTLERTIPLPSGPVRTEGRLLGAMFGQSSVPIGVVSDPTGRYALVAQSHADQVAIVDIGSGRRVATLPTGIEPDGLGWSVVGVRGR